MLVSLTSVFIDLLVRAVLFFIDGFQIPVHVISLVIAIFYEANLDRIAVKKSAL